MICIVGGSNIDIQGFSQTKLNLYDSNPGTIQKGFGGVGRNIAENLALLDTKPKLISPIGDDNFSNELIQYMKNVGCDMSDSMKLENSQLSTYLSVLNEENEMVVAIAAMDILEKFDKDFISAKKDLISKSDILVLDTNLKKDVLEYLSSTHKKTVIDLVSTKKAVKIKDFLGNFHTIKANKLEIEVITDITIKSTEDLIKAAKILLEKGVINVFITLGSEGIFYMNNEKNEIIANPDISAVDITGAGDSFAAGVAFSLYNNFEIEKMARCALSMSILNVTHLGTCFKGLNKNILNDTMKTYFNIEL